MKQGNGETSNRVCCGSAEWPYKKKAVLFFSLGGARIMRTQRTRDTTRVEGVGKVTLVATAISNAIVS